MTRPVVNFRSYLRVGSLEFCPVIKFTLHRESCELDGFVPGSDGFDLLGIAVASAILEKNLIPFQEASDSIIVGSGHGAANLRSPKGSESNQKKKCGYPHYDCLERDKSSLFSHF